MKHFKGTEPLYPLPEETCPLALGLPSGGDLRVGQAASRTATGKRQLCLVFSVLALSRLDILRRENGGDSAEGRQNEGKVAWQERTMESRTTARLPGRILSSSALGSHFLTPFQGHLQRGCSSPGARPLGQDLSNAPHGECACVCVGVRGRML